jgi:hypothetical protein
MAQTTDALTILERMIGADADLRQLIAEETLKAQIARMCNGLQSKRAGTAINGNLGPDYMHLSIPSGRDYLQLRLLLSSWDCNQRP